MMTTIFSIVLSFLTGVGSPVALSHREISLANRYPDPWVNEVMKKNILLTVAYLHGGFTIEPGQTVSFHDVVLPTYRGSRPLLSVHFSANEGYLSDGWLVGDGVCHLASLISWVAKDAQLFVDAPTSHDFRAIAEIPKEEAVSVYSNPNEPSRSAPQNLYITNTFDFPVRFVFEVKGDVLGINTVAKKSLN